MIKAIATCQYFLVAFSGCSMGSTSDRTSVHALRIGSDNSENNAQKLEDERQKLEDAKEQLQRQKLEDAKEGVAEAAAMWEEKKAALGVCQYQLFSQKEKKQKKEDEVWQDDCESEIHEERAAADAYYEALEAVDNYGFMGE